MLEMPQRHPKIPKTFPRRLDNLIEESAALILKVLCRASLFATIFSEYPSRSALGELGGFTTDRWSCSAAGGNECAKPKRQKQVWGDYDGGGIEGARLDGLDIVASS